MPFWSEPSRSQPTRARIVEAVRSLLAEGSFHESTGEEVGGVRGAAGDTDGDGDADLIVAAGPGGGPHVKVFSGQGMSLLQSFFAFDPSFTGGIFVG